MGNKHSARQWDLILRYPNSSNSNIQTETKIPIQIVKEVTGRTRYNFRSDISIWLSSLICTKKDILLLFSIFLLRAPGSLKRLKRPNSLKHTNQTSTKILEECIQKFKGEGNTLEDTLKIISKIFEADFIVHEMID